jgi:hypothetical protein
VRSMPNSATNGLASPAVLVICPASASAKGSSSWKRSAPHRGYLSGFCAYLGSGRTKALGTSLVAAAEAALETGRLTISGDEQTAALV